MHLLFAGNPMNAGGVGQVVLLCLRRLRVGGCSAHGGNFAGCPHCCSDSQICNATSILFCYLSAAPNPRLLSVVVCLLWLCFRLFGFFIKSRFHVTHLAAMCPGSEGPLAYPMEAIRPISQADGKLQKELTKQIEKTAVILIELPTL